jgi:epoxyqueuosine reductase
VKILLHICCGPCATYPFEALEGEGHEVDGYFYNPNIHPFTEYLLRRGAVEKLAEVSSRKVIFSPRYDFQEFFRRVVFRESERCRFCYDQRLKQAALVARKGKYDAFTTTLLISKQQKHELARAVGESVAGEVGVEFLYRDFRDGWKRHWELTEEYGLYKQQYCGCLYSEHERFKPISAESV